MNLIFLTMSQNTDVNTRGTYSDLMRKFKNEGHQVYIVGPCERREGKPTTLFEEGNIHLLKVKTFNLQKTSLVEKGLGQITLETAFLKAINSYFSEVQFDLILYSTPPITFCNVVKRLKKKNPGAISYLLLKDIFPQNALDLGVLNKSGLKGMVYSYFRNQELKLYSISDYIGCMSPANINYLLEHNDISSDKVEEAPNTYEVLQIRPFTETDKEKVRNKYHLPSDTPIFLYGGNFGKPQGISYLVDCLKILKDRKDCHFLIVGAGTEANKITDWIAEEAPENVTYIHHLPNEEYHQVVRSSDVGLIFLDHRFTIPNFPSRALDYLQYSKPMIIATDAVCDMGPIAEKGGYGYWCESVNPNHFVLLVNKMLNSDREMMGSMAYKALVEDYPIERTYNAIMRHVQKLL